MEEFFLIKTLVNLVKGKTITIGLSWLIVYLIILSVCLFCILMVPFYLVTGFLEKRQKDRKNKFRMAK